MHQGRQELDIQAIDRRKYMWYGSTVHGWAIRDRVSSASLRQCSSEDVGNFTMVGFAIQTFYVLTAHYTYVLRGPFPVQWPLPVSVITVYYWPSLCVLCLLHRRRKPSLPLHAPQHETWHRWSFIPRLEPY